MIDITTILDILPHRYPFLLVDRVLEIEPGRRAVGLKNVTFNEPFFSGHFPGRPIMPGVLLLEAMAQVGGVLLLHELQNRHDKLIYFTGIDNAKFRRPVVPGDQVRIEVEILKRRSWTCKLLATAAVDGQLAAEAQILSAMVDRGEAR